MRGIYTPQLTSRLPGGSRVCLPRLGRGAGPALGLIRETRPGRRTPSQAAGPSAQKMPEESPRRFSLDVISRFGKVVGIKPNIQKSIFFLSASSGHVDTGIITTIPLMPMQK